MYFLNGISGQLNYDIMTVDGKSLPDFMIGGIDREGFAPLKIAPIG